MTSTSNFKVSLFEIGDAKSCLYSWFCSPCALAESRVALDGSGCCFNLFCLPIIPYRWMVRSAYGIGDTNDCCNDCLLSIFCTCCVVNQLYQTTSAYGNPTTDGGRPFNINTWNGSGSSNGCTQCMKACCCLPCTIGEVNQNSMGMPFCMGCLFTNVCFTRNIIRYQYRVKNDTNSDCMDECLLQLVACIPNLVCAIFVPCIGCALYAAFIVALTMQIQMESESMSPLLTKKAYLTGFTNLNLVNATAGVVSTPPLAESQYIASQQQPKPMPVVSGTVLSSSSSTSSSSQYSYNPSPQQEPSAPEVIATPVQTGGA